LGKYSIHIIILYTNRSNNYLNVNYISLLKIATTDIEFFRT